MSSFYSTDGALRPDSPCYVERPADKDLFHGLLGGEFCSVFAPGQTGKSSLLARASHQLRQHGVHVVTLDLAAFPHKLGEADWYAELLARIGPQLNLEIDLVDFQRNKPQLSPLRRVFAALREVVLPKLKARDEELFKSRKESRSPASLSSFHAARGRLAIFLDGIDALGRLSFPTGDFWDEIAQVYERRKNDPDLTHLTFAFFGVAAPGAGPDPNMDRPFKIGRRIELLDFTADQAAPLAQGLKAEPPPPPPKEDGKEVEEKEETPGNVRPRIQIQNVNSDKILLERVLYWTAGHPYLTQRLCQSLHEALSKPASGQSTLATRDLVDQYCAELFFNRPGRESDANLQFVQQTILDSPADRGSLLDFFTQIHRANKRVLTDTEAPLAAILLRSGIVQAVNGSLRLRNRIYERVFDRHWITRLTPAAELTRQRAAFRRGMTRALAVCGVILAILAALAVIAFRQSRAAREEADRTGRLARANRDRLVQLNVANGARLLGQGALMSSLPWFAEAMNLVESDPIQEEMHRFRLQALLRQSPRLVQLCTHSERVNSVEFSADGRWLVSASADQTAQVWDLTSGERLTQPLKHEAAVLHASFSPDSSRVVTASADGTARLWETSTGQPIGPPWTHRGRVLRARFNAKGDRVVTASADGTARIWNALTGEAVTPPIEHQSAVIDAVFSPDGRRLATASSGDYGRVWDAATGQAITPALPHAGPLTSVAFAPDGTRVVTASQDGTARLWDAATGTALASPLKHNGPVSRAIFSPEGGRVVTAGLDNTARLWDAFTGESIDSPWLHYQAVAQVEFSPDARRAVSISGALAQVWDAHSGIPALPILEHSSTLACAAFNGDGSHLATACEDGTIRVWNVAAVLAEQLVLRHKSAVQDAAFSPDGAKLVTASGDGVVQVWDAATGQGLAQRLMHSGYVYQTMFSPQGNRILTLCEDGAARLVDDRTGAMVGKPMVHEGPVHHAAFSLDGRFLVTASYDQTARVWDTTTGNPVTPPLQHEGNVSDASFSASGDRVITASWDQTVRIWDPRNGRQLRPVLQFAARVNHASFSSDGRRIVTAAGNEARVWDAATGQPLTTVLRHEGEITAVAFSPDNRHVLTASRDYSARVWSVATGAPVTPLLKHRQPITDAAFSSDGLRVATASWDGTAQIWDVFTGQPITPPLKHGAAITRLSFSSDGHRLVTAGLDQTARVWNLPSEDRPAAALAAWAEVVSGQRIDSNGVLAGVTTLSLRETLSKFRSKYPADLGLAEEQTLTWHRVEAGQAETEGDWFAAVFHLDRLATAFPQDKMLRNRDTAARAAWIRANESRPKLSQPRQRPPRDSKAGPELIDLSNQYNDQLATGSWRELISALPHGPLLLAGTAFDARGVIVLAGKSALDAAFPERVSGIRVQAKCQRLHFLQALAHSRGLTEGTVVGTYVVHFADGQKREIPIRSGDDVADLQVAANAPLEIKGSLIAWTGASPTTGPNESLLRLFKTSLENPLPEVEISAIDFVSSKTEAAPFLLAITAER